jgi:2-oxoglutarate ferredoxin oxidoreductase subunit gamma
MSFGVKIAGIGGQGVQLAGKLLGEAAFQQGLNVSMGVNYEPATSGGLTVADITLAPKGIEIDYPFIEMPNILICFAQRAWDEFRHQVSSMCVVISDRDNVPDFEGPGVEQAHLAFHLPFSKMARELGSEKVTNVIVIGFLAEMLDIDEHFVPLMLKEINPEDAQEYELLEVSPQNFENSLIKASPERFKEMNLKAFKSGYQLSLDTIYSKDNISNEINQ